MLYGVYTDKQVNVSYLKGKGYKMDQKNLKNRWQQLAGIKEINETEVEKEQLNENFMNLGIASPGVMENPFGNRRSEPKYNYEAILEDMAPELDPEKVNVKEDHEGCMAHEQLEQIRKYADQLLQKLSKDAELEAWVQAKLTLAAEMMDVVGHYLQDEAGDDQKNDKKDADLELELVDEDDENEDDKENDK